MCIVVGTETTAHVAATAYTSLPTTSQPHIIPVSLSIMLQSVIGLILHFGELSGDKLLPIKIIKFPDHTVYMHQALT